MIVYFNFIHQKWAVPSPFFFFFVSIELNLSNPQYPFKRKTEQFYTRSTIRRDPKNNLQPRPEFFDGLYAFLMFFIFLFEIYHSWQGWGVCLGSRPEVKQMFLMVLGRAPGQISAHSARHIPLFSSPSPSLHLFCLSTYNSTQVSGCCSDWLSGSLRSSYGVHQSCGVI